MGLVVDALLKTKSPELDTGTAEALDKWNVNTPLEAYSTMEKLTDATRSLANGIIDGLDGIPLERFNIVFNRDSAL